MNTQLFFNPANAAQRPEPGLELVPGTHLRWDTPEEFAVRLALAGRKHCDALADAQQDCLPDAATLLIVDCPELFLREKAAEEPAT